MSIENVKRAAEIVKAINEVDQCDDAWDKGVIELGDLLRKSHGAVLLQLVKDGPVEDGDVISKSLRDDLINLGLATRVMHQDQFGFTSATYLGGFVSKVPAFRLPV